MYQSITKAHSQFLVLYTRQTINPIHYHVIKSLPDGRILNWIIIDRMVSNYFSSCNTEQLKISLWRSGTGTHTQTQTHTHTRARTHTHTHTHTHTCTHTQAHTHAHTHIPTHAYQLPGQSIVKKSQVCTD